MTRLVFPDESTRYVVDTKSNRSRRGARVNLYTDEAGTVAATGLLTLSGDPLTVGYVITDGNAMQPLFIGPDGVDTLWGRYVDPTGHLGPAWPIYARTDDRLDILGIRVSALEGGSVSTSSAITAETAARVAADSAEASARAAADSAEAALRASGDSSEVSTRAAADAAEIAARAAADASEAATRAAGDTTEATARANAIAAEQAARIAADAAHDAAIAALQAADTAEVARANAAYAPIGSTGITVIDNGDGTLSSSSTGIVDNGDGTVSAA